jgi:flagellar export protein FliJ
MRKSKRFGPIQGIAAASAAALSKSMGEAARKVADLERQLEQLQTYSNEYANPPAAGGAAMDPTKLQNSRAFFDRLGAALRQHIGKLDAARAEYERRRTLWSDKRIEAETLDRAIDRFRQQEQYDADQREQREADEAALRISLARAEAHNR